MRFSVTALLLAGFPVLSIASPVANTQSPGQESPPPSKHLRPVLEKRQQFAQGQPVNALGNGGPILGL